MADEPEPLEPEVWTADALIERYGERAYTEGVERAQLALLAHKSELYRQLREANLELLKRGYKLLVLLLALAAPAAAQCVMGINWATNEIECVIPASAVGGITIELDGQKIGQATTLQFLRSIGLHTLAESVEQRVTLRFDINESHVLTRKNNMLNTDRFVKLSSKATSDFVGTTEFTFSSYPTTLGAWLHFTPNYDCATGRSTLALNGLPAQTLWESDGSTYLVCHANEPILLTYDASFSGFLRMGGGTKPAPPPGSPRGLNNGHFASLRADASTAGIVQPALTIVLRKYHIEPNVYTKMSVISAAAVAGGRCRVGVYTLEGELKIDSGDLMCEKISGGAPSVGSFSPTQLEAGSYYIAWTASHSTVAMYGAPFGFNTNLRAWYNDGTYPAFATGGKWAGPNNPLPKQIVVDGSGTPSGFTPQIQLYH